MRQRLLRRRLQPLDQEDEALVVEVDVAARVLRVRKLRRSRPTDRAS